MRGVLGLVSLLIIGVGAALYFTETAPMAQQQGATYKKIESQADHAAELMQKSGQAAQDKVDAAMGETPAPSATNAPPAGN